MLIWMVLIASVSTGRTLSSCDNCPPNRCSWSNECYSCFLDRDNVCYPCQQGCKACAWSDMCTRCNDGYFLYTYTYMCYACPQNCKVCSSIEICKLCNEGYYLDNYTCHACPHNCKMCTGSNWCNLCNDGYYLYNHLCQSCQQSCETCINTAGYYWDSYRCQRCPQACATCASSDSCTSCSDGYYWDNYRCQSCPHRCVTCTSSDSCTSCSDGYYMHGYRCRRCAQGCATCSYADGCRSCNDRYYLAKDQCYQCPENCEACTFESKSKCAKCLYGFWGEHCGNSCNDTCIWCDKVTGECSGCKYNTFGQYCELKCSRSCLQLSDTNSTCWQHNGTCTYGCMQGFNEPDCTEDIPLQLSTNGVVIASSTCGGLVFMVIVVTIGIILWRRCVNRPDLKSGGERPSGALVPRAVTDTLNPAYDDIDIEPSAESGHRSTPVGTGINVGSADHVYFVVQKKSKRKPGQPNMSRSQEDGTDNVYDVASAGRSQGGATNTRFGSDAEGDTYSHINHTTGLRQHRHDNEGTYDHVTHQNLQKDEVDDTYDVVGGQYDHTVKAATNTSTY